MLKYEKLSNISYERNLQFEIYDPINKTRLDLSVCNNISIDIYVPVILIDKFLGLYNDVKESGYDIFDINSEFYQDICTPFKSSDGVDILLSDRVNYYYNNEETQCQPNCQFSEYSFEKQNLKCSCDIESNEINFDNDNKISSKALYASFYDVLKYSNYKVLKCYRLVLSVTIFKNNKGNIIVLVYFAIFLILLLIYCIKGVNELENDISINILNIRHKTGKNKKIKNSNDNHEMKINIRPIKKLQNIKSKNKIIVNDKKIKNLNKNSNKQQKLFNFPPKKEFFFKK